MAVKSNIREIKALEGLPFYADKRFSYTCLKTKTYSFTVKLISVLLIMDSLQIALLFYCCQIKAQPINEQPKEEFYSWFLTTKCASWSTWENLKSFWCFLFLWARAVLSTPELGNKCRDSFVLGEHFEKLDWSTGTGKDMRGFCYFKG